MSPAEINGLQHLAIAHGGSLTINPETGLPEASFMKDWLPSILGGLTMLIPGVGIPLSMALAAGTSFGTSMAVGNSFNKSLMAGLASGAGAGIGGAIGGAGAAAAGQGAGKATQVLGTVGADVATNAAARTAINAGVTGLEQVGLTAAQQATQQAAQQAGRFGATEFVKTPLAGLARVGAQSPTILPTTGVASNVGSALYNPATALATRGPSQATQFFSTAMPTGGRLPVDQIPGLSTKAVEFTPGLSNQAIFKAAGPMEKLSLMKQGAGEALKSPEAAGEFAWNNKGKLLALGTGVAGNMMSDQQTGIHPPPAQVSDYAGPYMPTPRTAQFPTGPQPWTDTSEFQYFNDVNPYPGYVAYDPKNKTPISAADGGLMSLTAGGSFDDEAGQDGGESTNYSYADGGEVAPNKMPTPDMTAIQNYVQSISPQQQGDPNALQGYMQGLNPQQGDPNALQNYLNNIGQQQQQPTPGRPQVPDILRQLPATPPQAPQIQAPIGGGEHDYGFKPVTVQQAPPVQYAPATKQKVNGMEALFGSLGMFGNANNRAFGKQAAPVPIVDKYTPYRPQTIDYTSPDGTKGSMEYTDLNNRVYNPDTQQMEIPLAVGGLTSLARGGNYLDGPGDGLSDSIRATIGNRQPARLADGEFVISADVVSDIGGGSSKAGAKKLHAMMDRVRQSAHGTKKQVKKINDRKVLAA